MPMTEIGIDVQMMTVERRSRRNRKMMRMTRKAPIIACSLTASIERLMKIELSSSTARRRPGISRLIRSISTRTASAISTVFFPDCFVTRIRMPGFPLMRVNERRSSVESLTSAMSLR